MNVIENEKAVLVVCVCCGQKKYSTRSPFLCHKCWRTGEAAKLIQQLTPRAADEVPECDCNTAQGFHEDSCAVTIFYAALRR